MFWKLQRNIHDRDYLLSIQIKRVLKIGPKETAFVT